MLKYVLLATAMTVAAPALAQTQAMPTQTAPTTAAPTTAAPTTATPTTSPEATATPPMDDAAAPTTAQAPTDPNAAPAQTAEATPVATDGVAGVVEKEFASYDKDGNGQLSKAEFSKWMDALKAKSPDNATAAADPKWNDTAFAQADTDKSKALSKTELTGFLTNASKGAS